MLPGSLVSSDVQAYSSYVQVNGVTRAHKSWSVERELVGDLPAQVVAAGGIHQATGTIVWAEQGDVTETAVNPWNAGAGWLPKPGDRVLIWVSDGVTSWRQFTGVIDDNTGDIGGLPSSSIIDDYDRLNVPFSHEAMLRIMPPLYRAEPEYRGVGLHSSYYVDAALRTAGFYATPKMEPSCAVSVPAQFSLWPERGTMTLGSTTGVDGGAWANTHEAPWGASMSNFRATYAPIIRYAMDRATQFTMMVAPDHTGEAFFTAYYDAGSTNYIRFSVTGNRTAVASLNGVEVCRVAMGSATSVCLVVKDGTWRLRTNAGAEAAGASTTPATGPLDRVVLQGNTWARVAGFQMNYPSTSIEFAPLAHTPSVKMHWTVAGHAGLMDAAPALENVPVVDLLQEISAATLTAMWIDEAGIFRWASSLYLRNQAPVQTVTTLDDIRSLSWEDSLLGVRSSVNVEHRIPAITRKRWDSVTLHQGSGETMQANEQSADFIKPDGDSDWIGVDSTVLRLGDPGTTRPMNGGWGSFAGGMLTSVNTETVASNELSFAFERIGTSTWKMTHSTGALPEDQNVELRFPAESTTIWERWWKEKLPIIRGFAKTDWETVTHTSAIRGPAFAPALTHDCGPWNARDVDQVAIPRIADYIAEAVSTPKPTITGMRLGYDPRRQLGDVIIISSPKLMGVRLTALIVDIRNSADGSYTQTVAVRIISARSTFTTYDQLAEAWASGNYASLDAAWAALNYDALASNPLEVTP